MPTGWRTWPRVHAQLLRDRQVKDEDTVRVILDHRPPRFEIGLASHRVLKGSDIRIDVHDVERSANCSSSTTASTAAR